MKASTEMLMRRRLVTLKQLIDEYSLVVDITLIASEQNLADWLTIAMHVHCFNRPIDI